MPMTEAVFTPPTLWLCGRDTLNMLNMVLVHSLHPTVALGDNPKSNSLSMQVSPKQKRNLVILQDPSMLYLTHAYTLKGWQFSNILLVLMVLMTFKITCELACRI